MCLPDRVDTFSKFSLNGRCDPTNLDINVGGLGNTHVLNLAIKFYSEFHLIGVFLQDYGGGNLMMDFYVCVGFEGYN